MQHKIEISEIDIKEINQAATTLNLAFKNDPLFRWVFNDEKAYSDKSTLLFATWIKYAVLYGRALKTKNFESIAIRKKTR